MFSVPENLSPDGSNMPDTARGGRPRLPQAERRVIRVGVNVNVAEYAVIQSRAEAAGMSPAVFLRDAGLGTRIGAKVNGRVYHELSRIGVNLNQLARVANQTGRLPEVKQLQAILNVILEMRSEM